MSLAAEVAAAEWRRRRDGNGEELDGLRCGRPLEDDEGRQHDEEDDVEKKRAEKVA